MSGPEMNKSHIKVYPMYMSFPFPCIASAALPCIAVAAFMLGTDLLTVIEPRGMGMLTVCRIMYGASGCLWTWPLVLGTMSSFCCC